ncbi:MAG TPA: M81 family peptidase [Armatimonadetes bacterium]|nr:M81 family peptidase [Armatimonadota bacterium]
MRIAVGGLMHESNTFAPQLTTMADFEQGRLDEGEAVLSRWAGSDSEVQGFLDAAERNDFTLVPTFFAWAMPAGPVAERAYQGLLERLRRRIAEAQPVDGVLLALHGAMVTESDFDPDGTTLAAVRDLIGPEVPLVATLDLHANTTPRMVEQADLLVAYQTYPHLDLRACGRRAGDLLARILSDRLRPTMVRVHPPLITVPQKQVTAEPPLRDLLALADHYEHQPGVVSISIVPGFAYADVPEVGFSVIVVTNDNLPQAQAIAEDLADLAWCRRREFIPECLEVAEAVKQALAEPRGPVVLADVGDNVGGGAPGDGTVLLRELLAQGAQNAVVLLADPEAVAQACTAGVRRTVKLEVGGKTDELHGEPVRIRGYVRLLSDGRFVNRGPLRDGLAEDQGRTAVLECDGVTLVLTERKMPMWNRQQLRSLGIEPRRQKIIVVKGAIAHRAAYGPIAARLIDVDTPGLTPLNLRRLEFKHAHRPLFPLDEM